MPAGRPIWKLKPHTLKVLEAMVDGRFYYRPILRELTGLPHDSLSPAIRRLYQSGKIIQRLNPKHDHVNPHQTLRRVGLEAAKYVYRITDEGREALNHELVMRQMLDLPE